MMDHAEEGAPAEVEKVTPMDEQGLMHRPAYWTCDDDPGVGPLYYFAPSTRRPPPYTRQIEVRAIIDIADDGTLAGVELIYDMPPPPHDQQTDDR